MFSIKNIRKFNAAIIKKIKAENPEPNLAITDPNWKGYPMRLYTDGRRTKVVKEKIDGCNFKWIYARFACPYCGEFALLVNANETSDLSAKVAECMECSAAIISEKHFLKWKQGELVHVHG